MCISVSSLSKSNSGTFIRFLVHHDVSLVEEKESSLVHDKFQALIEKRKIEATRALRHIYRARVLFWIGLLAVIGVAGFEYYTNIETSSLILLQHDSSNQTMQGELGNCQSLELSYDLEDGSLDQSYKNG